MYSLLLQAATFVVVTTCAVAGLRILQRNIAIRRRLGEEPQSQLGAKVLRDDTISSKLLRQISQAFLSDVGDRAKLRADLSRAGFDSPAAPVWYVVARFGAAIGLPLVYIGLNNLLNSNRASLSTMIVPLALCGAGLIVPRSYIQSRVAGRRRRIEEQFPDALDLITVCMEAGLSLDAAFIRVGEETHESHPEICREFRDVADELSAGRTRADALRSMGERTDVQSIKAFVALLVQTEALGVSIAQSLRTYAGEMRESRFLRAEEKAMRIPVLMTMPLVACFMPVMIVALLLPSAIDLVRSLLPALNGTSH